MPTKCLAPPSLPSSPTPNPAALLPSTFHAFHRNAPPPLSLFARSVRRHEFGLRDAIPSPSTSHAVHDERSLHVLTWQRYGHDGGGGGECAAVEPETGTRCAKEVYMFVRTSMVVGRGCASLTLVDRRGDGEGGEEDEEGERMLGRASRRAMCASGGGAAFIHVQNKKLSPIQKVRVGRQRSKSPASTLK